MANSLAPTDPPIRAFIAYSHDDKRFQEQLVRHLSPLERENRVSVWYDGEILPGAVWDQAIKDELRASKLILLLISANFIASEYCYKTELEHAMTRHRQGTATVVPVIVSACDWQSLELGKIQALPQKAKPVDEWRPRSRAWTEVAKGIRRIVMKGALGNDIGASHDGTSAQPHPRDRALGALKSFLVDDRYRIQLHDLVMDEVDRVHTALTAGPSYPTGLGLTGQALADALPQFESLSETLVVYFATGCRWGTADHHELWIEALTKLASVPSPNMWNVSPGFRVNLHRYPTLLALYAGGIAAVASNRYDTLAVLLLKAVAKDVNNTLTPLATSAHSERVIEFDAAKTVPAWRNRRLPFNQYLCANADLWSPVRDAIPASPDFATHLDRFEYLLGLVAWDMSSQRDAWAWAPISCFAWRDHNEFWNPDKMPVFDRFIKEIEATQENWPPLRAGLFGGSTDRLVAAIRGYNRSIALRGSLR